MRAVDPAQEELIRKGYAAFARGDLEAAVESFVPEATFTNPDYAIEAGVRSGVDQVRAALQSLHDQFEFSVIEVDQIVEGPRGVLVAVHVSGRGRASGAPLEGRFFHVFQIRGEQTLDFAWFMSLEEARQAVGL
jgi:ketosteroid isomerase-like protein